MWLIRLLHDPILLLFEEEVEAVQDVHHSSFIASYMIQLPRAPSNESPRRSCSTTCESPSKRVFCRLKKLLSFFFWFEFDTSVERVKKKAYHKSLQDRHENRNLAVWKTFRYGITYAFTVKSQRTYVPMRPKVD